MKKSFLNYTTPFITEMVQTPTPNQAIEKISNATKDGATAIGFQMNLLKREYHNKEALTSIFKSAGDTPIYFTNYRKDFNAGLTDEELVNGLFLGLECGATLIDVMGDTFCPCENELSMDANAVEKQINLINEIHNRGGEVIMSSHVHKFLPPEKVLEMAIEQQRRGVDIVKIVTGAETEEEQLINFEICNLLKKELKIPFLFLSNGKFNYLHRTVGPALGVCMWLCFREYDETTYVGPPLLADVLKVKQGLKL